MLCSKNTPPGSNDPDTIALRSVLKNIFDNRHFVLCQIGANDGISADPIYDIIKQNKNIEAHLVEPQQEAFKLLVQNYSNIHSENRVYFYNYALTNTNTDVKLYKNTAENGTDGHSSLLLRDLDVVNNIVVAKYTENDYELVKGITCAELNIQINKNIDVLVIDTEGYDVEIIKMYIENNIFPKVIYFERPGISGKLPDNHVLLNREAELYIENNLNNYIINKLQDNWLCIKKD